MLYNLNMYYLPQQPFYHSYVQCSLYRLPFTQQEAILRARINRYSLQGSRKLVTALFPNGEIQGGFYLFDGIAFALEKNRHCPSNISLEPGEWIDQKRSTLGYNFEELVAYKWNLPYAEAVEMVANHLVLTNKENEGVYGWEQERQPLYPFFSVTYSSNTLAYHNAMGIPIAIVAKFHDNNGITFPVFWIITKQKKTGQSKIIEAFPEAPYHLYNQHMIARNPSEPIFIAQDEFYAEYNKRIGYVNSAIPGGLDNILEADFSCLEGRSVCINLRNR